jgi:hypothetical protein
VHPPGRPGTVLWMLMHRSPNCHAARRACRAARTVQIIRCGSRRCSRVTKTISQPAACSRLSRSGPIRPAAACRATPRRIRRRVGGAGRRDRRSPPIGRRDARETALPGSARQVPGGPEAGIRAGIAPSDRRAPGPAALARCRGRAARSRTAPALPARQGRPATRRPDRPPRPGADGRAASRRRCGGVSQGEPATTAAPRQGAPRSAAGPRLPGETTSSGDQQLPRLDRRATQAGHPATSPPTAR